MCAPQDDKDDMIAILEREEEERFKVLWEMDTSGMTDSERIAFLLGVAHRDGWRRLPTDALPDLLNLFLGFAAGFVDRRGDATGYALLADIVAIVKVNYEPDAAQ